MTFIASVVAKKGVAVIADSLVTTSKYVMEYHDFVAHIKKVAKPDGSITLVPKELVDLFKSTASHTKNYEEKLFKYDDYTAVTCAGSAQINGKRIAEIIEELKIANTKNKRAYNSKKLETKVKDLCEHFAHDVQVHIANGGYFSGTSFLYTHYNKKTHKTTIFKIELVGVRKADLSTPDFEYYSFSEQPTHFKVVCDGQNRISERILWGDLESVVGLVPKIVQKVILDNKITITDIDAYTKTILEFLRADLTGDIKITQLSKLSLQQAVDLACLFMRLEMDIQAYTKNVPTVGGLIKLATIDDGGFQWLSGHDITKPKYIR